MSGQGDSAVTLPKNVSVTIGGRTFQGECPGRLLVAEHKLRKIPEKSSEKKKASTGSSKSD